MGIGQMTTYLSLRWTVSRAADTYGYNVITLTDAATGKRYRASGGGYDMKGTVFGEWLQDVHQDALCNLAAHTVSVLDTDGKWSREYPTGETFYGLRRTESPSKRGDGDNWVTVEMSCDGACGFESMRRIAEAIGLTVRTGEQDRKGNALGYIIEGGE